MTCTQKRGPWSSSISIRSLEHLFQPGSMAVIGASDRPQSLVATPLRNLLEGGFAGPIWPVKPGIGNSLRQKNLWASFGSGSLPST